MPQLSKKHVEASFNGSDATIWARQPLLDFVAENRYLWETSEAGPGTLKLPPSASNTQVINVLVKVALLRSIKFSFPYRNVTRFLWGEASTLDLIQSVDPLGYFSHYTAVQYHELTDQIPKAFYFNVEQPATGGGGSLTQGGIDRAFKGKCRVSNNVLEFRDATIHKLNGQNTGRLGMESVSAADGSAIQVTNLERTLIDIAVRPIYSGGIAEVASAYEAAAPKVSANRLATYLKNLNYTYPYHQAIGYYMERAGNYTDAQLSKLRAFPIDFNFYLTYQLKNPVLNESWRLYVPKGF